MIQIQNLHFSYKKKRTLFHDLSLEFKPGKIYGLLGKNGTGKSTLLKLITGGLFPDEGTVTIEGNHSRLRDPNILEDIYLLPEDHDIPAISISAFAKAYAPFYPKFDHDKFSSLVSLFEVNVDGRLNSLSYGQRKKVLISFGIATNTKYLILDEPTNGLDIPSKSQFRKALLSGFREDQIIIISTHQIKDLNHLIESIVIIEDGTIILDSEVSQLEDSLLFSRHLSEVDLPNLIYREGSVGSYTHVQSNTTSQPSKVDLEVLFNAVIDNPSAINQHLKSETYAV